jgi:DNA-binding IclR family transcriptional regulator
MSRKGSRLALKESQTACLVALRHRKCSTPRLAIEAKLGIKNTATALRALTQLGLVEREGTRTWQTTARGATCRFETVPDRPRRTQAPGPSSQRLLDMLDRPMRGSVIAERLGVTRQRVRQLVVRLHAEGQIAFGDPDDPFWIVMRVDNKSLILSCEEEHVLSALPRERAADAARIRTAVRLPASKVEEILGRLISGGLADGFEGLRGLPVFRVTAAGLKHSQFAQNARRATGSRLPVQSDRIRSVLSAISDSGALRIKEVAISSNSPHQSINALMQYLKRKRLVAKVGQEFDAPYSLTKMGRATLAEMTLRHAA